MKNRIVCALLALLMVISLVPVTAVTASAASVSNELINFVMIEENDEQEEYTCEEDNTQYSIGFGTRCDKVHEGGEVHTITFKEAKEALIKELGTVAGSVSSFASKNGLNLSQSQFDALVSFSYNCGTGWMSADGHFRQAVLGGKTGNDFLYAITLWSVGGAGLAPRRLKEANMYLNGVYSNQMPSNYSYVRLNPNGGTVEYTTQAFDTQQPVSIKETPVREGYLFMGWFDPAGNWVTTLNSNVGEKTLTARWQKVDGGGIVDGTIEGTKVSYKVSGSKAADLNIYKLPGTGTEVLGTIKRTDTLSVEAEYIDIDNVKWVKLVENGWVSMGKVNEPVIDKEDSKLIVKVTSQYINVRKKPSAGATSAIVGKVYMNEELEILEVQTVGTALWGKTAKGWIALQYTNYSAVADKDPAEEEQSSDIISDGSKTVIATGKVTVSTYVNVRKGPDTEYAVVNKVNNGTLVTFYQIEKKGDVEWGRINTGWICMRDGGNTYVVLDETVEMPDDNDSAIIASGYVNSNSNLSVRKGPGVTKAKVTTLPSGTKIDIYETKKVSGHTWGRIDPAKDHWVCLTYVTLQEAGEINGQGVKGTIVNCTAGANIRSAAGIANALVGVAPVGSTVTVYQQKTIANGTKWGRIDKGWVCMDYVLLESSLPGTDNETGTDTTPDTTPEVETSGLPTGTITAEYLNIYAEATSSSKVLGTLIRGTKISASKLEVEEGTSNIWGKTAGGWVNMAYVKVDAVAVINTKTGGKLNVRDESCDTSNKPVKQLDNGTQVSICAIKVVSGGIWGCIDEENGYWINLSLVKLNETAASGGTTPDAEQKPETEQKPITPDVPNTNEKTGVIANTNYVNVRSAAGVGNALVTTLARGTKVTIYEQVTKDNAPWGRIGENQWVAMVYVTLDTPVIGGTTGGNVGGTTGGSTGNGTHATGIVNSNVNLNVRTGPGTNYPMVSTLSKGTMINIYEQKLVNGMTWGRIDQGWVSLNYVTITSSGSTGKGVMGTIARCYYAVNVRSAPGVGNALVGTIMVGSRVEIYEQKAYGGVNWGRVNQGWISMEYVLLDSEIPGGGIPGLGNGDNTGTQNPGTQTPGTEQKPDTEQEPNYVTGFSTGVAKHDTLDYVSVLKEADGTEVVGTIINGSALTATDLDVVNGRVWGKVANGWVDMTYVDVTAYAVVKTKTGGQLNVRDESCDTSKKAVSKLDDGTQVTITDIKAVDDGVWGCIDSEKGYWISLSLVKLNAKAPATNNSGSTTGGTTDNGNTGNSGTTGGNNSIGNNVVANGSVLYTGKVTGTVDGVRIRSTPSTNATTLGKMANGTAVNVYDIAVAEFMAWGKTDSGWVCLTYVDLQSVKEGAVDARVVWTDGLAIRADAGANYEQLASYAKCTVVDLYETRGNWGRTIDGWVCLDYLLP